MSTATRVGAAVIAGLLSIGLAVTPAVALRLVPVEPAATIVPVAPDEDPSLLLSMGRVTAQLDADTGSADHLFMSIGRLPR